MNAGVGNIDYPVWPRHEEASREFHKTYESYPAYELLANIGIGALCLNSHAEILDSYEGYLQKATGKDVAQSRRALMDRDMATHESGLAQLEIAAALGSVTFTDKRFALREGRLTIVTRLGWTRESWYSLC
jgi:hypothetical protein